MTFNFNNSDTLDWILISEVMMFTDTGKCNDHSHIMSEWSTDILCSPHLQLYVSPPQPPIIFTQDQVIVVRTTGLVSSVRLTCSVANDAAFEWSWSGSNGVMISSSSSVFVADLTRTSVLQIV